MVLQLHRISNQVSINPFINHECYSIITIDTQK